MSFQSIVKAVNPIGGDTCEILLYGEIETYYGITADSFIKELTWAEQNYTKIIIRIHCPGGNAFEGWTIFNAIRNSKAHITTCVDGVAASMGSVILLAGKRIIMNKFSLLMIHNPSVFASGDEEDLQKAIELLKVIRLQLVEAYVKKTGKPSADIEAMMKAETWLSADEALAQGFIDEIKDGIEEMPEGYPTNYKNLKPQNAASLFTSRIAAMITGTTNYINMNKSQICAALGLDPNTADDVVLAKVKEVAARAERLGAVEAKANTEAAAAKASKINASVEKAIEEGRIVASAKDSFIKIGETQGCDELDKVLATLTAHKPLAAMITPVTGAAPVAGAWDKTLILEWLKHDPDGLKALEVSNPTAYKALK